MPVLPEANEASHGAAAAAPLMVCYSGAAKRCWQADAKVSAIVVADGKVDFAKAK